MKSILLATGERSKLVSLTTHLSSPMLPLVNRPVMVYAIELLARHQMCESYICLQQFSEDVEAYFGNGERWNLKLSYLPQRKALGSAGVLKRLQSVLRETFIVLPADVVFDFDLQEAIAYHKTQGSLLTVLLSQARPGMPSDTVHCQLDGQGKIAALVANTSRDPARAHAEQQIFAPTGIYIVEPEALQFVPTNEYYDCVEHLLPALLSANQAAYGYIAQGYWNPLHSIQDYQEAQQSLLDQLVATPSTATMPRLASFYADGKEIAPGIWSGPQTTIHPTAKLTAPVVIGNECHIGANCEIGPYAVIGPHTLVDDGATIEDSTVLSRTYVGRLAHLADRVVSGGLLIDATDGNSVLITDPWLLGNTHPSLIITGLRMLVEQFIALVLFIGLFPFLLLIGCLAWLTAGGPILQRVDCFGSRPSLFPTTPSHLALVRFRTRKADHSYTPVGKWLEMYQVHRLPELWNVLVRTIALVGVKPLTQEERALITEEWQRQRYQQAAGFTGLWYTQTASGDSFDMLSTIDAYQVATMDFVLFLQVLGRTPIAWWHHWNQARTLAKARATDIRSHPITESSRQFL